MPGNMLACIVTVPKVVIATPRRVPQTAVDLRCKIKTVARMLEGMMGTLLDQL